MRVIGTAGHVDHGKSTLVEALTGTHPDRLKEEREREMTIDLGFAWLTLPGGEEIGIVDVPGHRDFIENMLAGVGGVDAALFVVAADEGVMPQTREHLAILDLLQIDGGVVALTKTDLVDDSEWLDLVESDLRQALRNTVLAEAPIVRVSARQRTGIEALKSALSACLAGRPPRPNYGRPRLPVDRVFTVAGFGSVVTGTLTDGLLAVGDEVEILPAGLRGRVRGLQTHKKKEETAVPGSRTAVNVSGIAVEALRRGDVLAHPGDYQPSRRLDARFRLLADAAHPVRHNLEVKLYIGAAEVVARLRLLGSEELLPGETGWLQLELSEPVVALRGDRYILRRPSPGETLGGGEIVDPHPRGRHKRFSEETLATLETLAQGSPAEVVLQALLALGAAPLKEVGDRAKLPAPAFAAAAAGLVASGQMINLDAASGAAARGGALPGEEPLPQPGDLVIGKGAFEQLTTRTIQEVKAYHQAYPLRAGMPREELKSRLKTALQNSNRLFNALLRSLVDREALLEAGPLVRQPGHSIRFSPAQQEKIDRLLKRFNAAPFAPPSPKESIAEVGEDIWQALVEQGRFVLPAPDVAFRREDFDQMLAEVRVLFKQHGTLTAAQFRDHFNTSRKYALAFLEYLDARGVTIREGDARRLKSA